MKIKVIELLDKLFQGTKLVCEKSIEAKAPKVFIAHLAQATKEIGYALEIAMDYDSKGSN